MLDGLGLTMNQFVDLCILLGCDYVDTIRGIGPKKAVDLLQKHKSIEAILANLDRTKYPVPEDWPFAEAKKLFINPEVADPETIEASVCVCMWECFWLFDITISPTN